MHQTITSAPAALHQLAIFKYAKRAHPLPLFWIKYILCSAIRAIHPREKGAVYASRGM